MNLSVIIPAGGSSSRFGKNKLLEKLSGKEIILYSVELFSKFDEVSEIILPVFKEIKEEIKNLTKKFNKVKFVDGGKTRQESVYNALKKCDKKADFVLIHDGARPLIKKETVEECIKMAKKQGNAIVCTKTTDTIKIAEKSGKIIYTPNRDYLWNVQTPQIFNVNDINMAHEHFKGENFTDDAGMLEALNIPVYIVSGEPENIKITNKSDIELAEKYLQVIK